MRKLLILLVLVCPEVLAQSGVRVSSTVTQAANVAGVSNQVVTIPANATVSFCNAPANAVPCTNKATTYTDATLGVACSSSTQIVRDGTNTCVATPDSQGNWGVWVASGQYAYTVTVNGTNTGPYFVTAGGSGGGGGGGGTKPAVSDAIQFASPNGNDTNDGLSWGTAKATIDAALCALPGGSCSAPVTAGSGTVYFTNNVQPCANSTSYGIMLMGPSDPNYATPPTCWVKVTNTAGQSINIVGVPKSSSSVANITTSTTTNRNLPAVWLSATQEDIHIDHLGTQNFMARGVVVGECSTNVRTGTCQSSKVYFNYVSPLLNLVAGDGPDWDITGTSFWIYIFHSAGEGSLGVNGASSNLTPSFLFDGAGIIFMEDIQTSGGAGVKFINVPASDGATIHSLYLEGDGGTDNPAVWVTNTNGTQFAFEGIGCADGSMVAVEVDNGNPTDTFVAGAQGSGSVGNVKGPMNILSQYNGNNAEFVLDPYVNSEVGFYGPTGRVLGQIDQARYQLHTQPVAYTNLVPPPGSWTPLTGITITTGVAGSPDRGSNAIRLTDSGAQSGANAYVNTQTFSVGDWIVYAGWVRSPDGSFTGGVGPLEVGFSSGPCIATFNPPLQSGGLVLNLPGTATNWQWTYTAGKVTTGGSCQVFLAIRADSTHRTDVYGLVGNYIPTGTWDDQTVLQYVSNLSSYPSTCTVGNACDSTGRTPVLSQTQQPRQVWTGVTPSGTPQLGLQQQCYNPSSGTITGSYTVAGVSGASAGDFACILYVTGGPITVPDAASTGFINGFDFTICNPGQTLVQVNRQTSSVFNFLAGPTGVTTFNVNPGSCDYVSQQGNTTNWNVFPPTVQTIGPSSGYTFTSTPITTAPFTGNLLIGAVINGTDTNTYVAGAGWTIALASGGTIGIEYQTATSASSYTAAFTQSSSQVWAGTISAFTTTTAPSLVQASQSGSGHNSLAYVSNNTAGNLLFAIFRYNSTTGPITGVTDTRSNTWHLIGLRAPEAQVKGLGDGNFQEIWYAANCASGANTVTAAGISGATAETSVSEWSGVATTSPFVDYAYASSASASTSVSGATTNNQYLISAINNLTQNVDFVSRDDGVVFRSATNMLASTGGLLYHRNGIYPGQTSLQESVASQTNWYIWSLPAPTGSSPIVQVSWHVVCESVTPPIYTVVNQSGCIHLVMPSAYAGPAPSGNTLSGFWQRPNATQGAKGNDQDFFVNGTCRIPDNQRTPSNCFDTFTAIYSSHIGTTADTSIPVTDQLCGGLTPAAANIVGYRTNQSSTDEAYFENTWAMAMATPYNVLSNHPIMINAHASCNQNAGILAVNASAYGGQLIHYQDIHNITGLQFNCTDAGVRFDVQNMIRELAQSGSFITTAQATEGTPGNCVGNVTVTTESANGAGFVPPNFFAAGSGANFRVNESTKFSQVGLLTSSSTSAATTGTTKQTLATYTFPFNNNIGAAGASNGPFLNNPGAVFRITAWGVTAANGDSKTVEIDFGGITVASITSTVNANAIKVSAEIVVGTAANTQEIIGYGDDGTIHTVTRSSPNQNGSATIVVNLAATTGTLAGDFTFKGWTIEYVGGN